MSAEYFDRTRYGVAIPAVADDHRMECDQIAVLWRKKPE